MTSSLESSSNLWTNDRSFASPATLWSGNRRCQRSLTTMMITMHTRLPQTRNCENIESIIEFSVTFVRFSGTSARVILSTGESGFRLTFHGICRRRLLLARRSLGSQTRTMMMTYDGVKKCIRVNDKCARRGLSLPTGQCYFRWLLLPVVVRCWCQSKRANIDLLIRRPCEMRTIFRFAKLGFRKHLCVCVCVCSVHSRIISARMRSLRVTVIWAFHRKCNFRFRYAYLMFIYA